MMRKTLLLFLLAVSASFVFSCSKSSDADVEPALTGTWYLDRTAYYLDGKLMGTEPAEGCDTATNIQIAENYEITYEKVLICNGYSILTGIYNPETELVKLFYRGDEEAYDARIDLADNELRMEITFEPYDENSGIESDVHYFRKGASKED